MSNEIDIYGKGELSAAGKNIHASPELLKTYLGEEIKNPHLRDYLDVLIRRKKIVIIFMISVFLAVLGVTFLMTPEYKARATVRIKNNSPRIMIFKDTYEAEKAEEDYYETQYKILKSRNLAERAVTRLSSEKKFESTNEGFVSSAIHGIVSDINGKDKNGYKKDKKISTGYFMDRLEIQPVQKSQLVDVMFSSPDPVFAAYAANTVVDEYREFTLESKLMPNVEAKKRLEKELEAMRMKLGDSEEQLNNYITNNPFFIFDKENDYENILTKKLEKLSDELYQVTTERISKEAIYEEVKKKGIDYSVVLQDPLIQSLTIEYAKLESEYFNLLRVHKPAYPKMLRLKKQIDQLKKRIEAEEQKVINSVNSDYKIALQKENYLSSAIERLREDISDFQQNFIQFQILKREVESNRDIYNSLLQKFKEVGITAAVTGNNIQVLDKASVPKSPYKPKKVLNIALSLVFGLMGGVFLAFFIEYFDNTVKTDEDVERASNLPVIGTVPISLTDPSKYSSVKQLENTAFAETFRSIGTCIRYSNASRPPKQILVTSPIEREGKTVLSVNLAMNLVKSMGKGVIVDADLRNPNVHKFFSIDNSKGLSSFLAGHNEFSDVIKNSRCKGLDIVTSGPMPPDPSGLLNSSRMRELMDTLSATYDYVIVDSAPVLGMSDSLILSAITDRVIIVARADSTPQDALAQTKKALNSVNAKILGIVLNGVDKQTKYSYLYCSSQLKDNKTNRKKLLKRAG